MRPQDLRVAIGPVDPAGTAGALAAGLRELGAHVEVTLWFSFTHRRVNGRALGRASRLAYVSSAPTRREIFHYQSFSWLPSLADAAWASVWRRTLVTTFHGDDCRLYGLAQRLFPPRGNTGDPTGDDAVERRVQRLGRLCAGAIVPDLELATYVLPHFRRVYVVPPALESEPAADDAEAGGRGERPVVLHAPSDPALKGTELIQAAVDRLAQRLPLEFRLLTGVAHHQAVSEIRRADVVVDQLNSANVGVVALEAMRAERPVVSQVVPRALAPYQADLPVVPATADSLDRELEALIRDPERRRDLGQRGRRYVARHDPVSVARATLRVYAHARTGARGLFEATPDAVRPLHEVERELRELRQAALRAGDD